MFAARRFSRLAVFFVFTVRRQKKRSAADSQEKPLLEINLSFRERKGHAKTARGNAFENIPKPSPLSAKGSVCFPERNTGIFPHFFSLLELRKTVKESSCFLGRPSILHILHQIGGLTIQHFTDFIQCLDRQMLNCPQADCRNCGRPDTCLFC